MLVLLYSCHSPSPFILYTIVYWLSVVAKLMLACPPLHVTCPFCVTVPVIALIVIALETVSVLLPALSTVKTCK